MTRPDYSFLDRAIAVRPDFLELLDGDHRAAIMLSQAVYWQLRQDDGDDGWWYKARDKWRDETWIPKDAQARCRSSLRQHDWWEEKKDGMPQRLYYRIDLEALDEAIRELAPDGGDGGAGGGASDVSAGDPGGPTPSERDPRHQGVSDPDTKVSQTETPTPPPPNARARSKTSTKTSDNETSCGGSLIARDADPSVPDPSSDGDDLFPEVDRDSPPPDAPRLSIPQLQTEWRDKLGQTLDVDTDRLAHERAAAMTTTFSADEIREALQITRRQASSPGWGYVREVLVGLVADDAVQDGSDAGYKIPGADGPKYGYRDDNFAEKMAEQLEGRADGR